VLTEKGGNEQLHQLIDM